MNLIANAIESMEQNSEWPRELELRVSEEGRMVLTEIAVAVNTALYQARSQLE
jgi:hypothetical protein